MQTTQAPYVNVAIKNILVATDFSPASNGAFWIAAAIAKRYGATLHIAHVIAPPVAGFAYAGTDVDRYYREARLKALQQIAELGESSAVFGINHHEILEDGEIVEALERLRGRNEVDLVVVGTHGAKGISKVMIGSVAEQILRRMKVPVLTVGPEVAAVEGEIPVALSEVLYPTDLSPQSLSALPYALSLAKANVAQLTLLYVHTHSPSTAFADQAVLRSEYGRELAKLVSGGTDLWSRPVIRVEFGKPDELILAVAAERRTNLIVLGVRYEREFADHLPWSVASRVIRAAHCPVLTIRGPRS